MRGHENAGYTAIQERAKHAITLADRVIVHVEEIGEYIIVIVIQIQIITKVY